jgi:hypothetical protein
MTGTYSIMNWKTFQKVSHGLILGIIPLCLEGLMKATMSWPRQQQVTLWLQFRNTAAYDGLLGEFYIINIDQIKLALIVIPSNFIINHPLVSVSIFFSRAHTHTHRKPCCSKSGTLNTHTWMAWFSFAHSPPDSCDGVPRMLTPMSVFLLAGLHLQTQGL